MYSKLLFPPQKLFELEDNRILVIGMNGEIQILDENLTAEFEHKKPFPTSISISSVSKNTLFACWIDLELMIARMASINLDSKINNGITRAELRRKLESKSQPQVESSKWSHILDSEPLALISNEQFIVFNSWKRGLYCVDHESNELWRIPEIKWKNKIKNANIIISIEITDKGLLVWSKAAEWFLINKDNGEILENGQVEFENILEKVFVYENKRLLCSPNGFVLWIEDLDSQNPLKMKQKGPVHDAKWDLEKNCWRICQWREDILWSKSEIQKSNRKEIGKSVFKHKEKWIVLENSGSFSEHYS